MNDKLNYMPSIENNTAYRGYFSRKYCDKKIVQTCEIIDKNCDKIGKILSEEVNKPNKPP